MTAVSVLLIDRSQLFREGIRRILGESSFSIDREGNSLQEVLEMPGRAPDLAMINLESVTRDSRAQLDDLRGLYPAISIVILADRAEATDLAAALAARVDGYLLKDVSVDALRQSLQLVMMGQKVFPSDLTHYLVNERMVTEPGTTVVGQNIIVTDREKQILAGLLNGLSNKSIAKNLGVAEATVKALLKNILKKIRLRNRTQAAIWALTHGIATDAFLPLPPAKSPPVLSQTGQKAAHMSPGCN